MVLSKDETGCEAKQTKKIVGNSMLAKLGPAQLSLFLLNVQDIYNSCKISISHQQKLLEGMKV